MNDSDGAALLDLARAAILSGLETGQRPDLPVLGELPLSLQRPAGAFVTLSNSGALRGCIGSLETRFALAQSVAMAAFNAAFLDPRFTPLVASELPELEVEISVPGPLEHLGFASDEELLAQLQPHRDGLLIEQGARRATFLPQVWAGVASPAQFLAHLKHKAGLPAEMPLAGARAWRYRAEIVCGELIRDSTRSPTR